MTPVLCDARGPIVVGERIGGGGEGEIFRVGKRPGVVLKLYHKPTAAHEAKVTAMIDARLHVASRSITFPVSIVRDARKRFVGFTMAEVREHAPIHELYATTSRRTAFPDADYRFLVRAAANVARAVAQVHAVGAVVGDINHSGFLVSPSATVVAIDADSFAIGSIHRCTVGVPDFTPPELQGQDLSTVGRTAQHDAFGLAVLIFQLLFLGRHPFAGRPSGRDVDIPGAVAQGRFAYSRIRDTRLAPPPGALSFARLPIAMRVAFERAFAIGLGHRPTAEHWLTLLDAFEQNLVRCATNGRHQFAPALDDCPFCEMDARSKLPIFGLVKPTALTGSAGALIKRGRGLLRDAHNLLDADLPIGTPSPGPSRKAIKQKQDPYFHTPEEILNYATLKPFRAECERPYVDAADQLETAIAKWRERPETYAFAATLRQVERRLGDFERQALNGRTGTFGSDTASLAAITEHLRSHSIGTAATSNLSTRNRRALTDAGIVTAADVRKNVLERVHGLGSRTIAILLLWRDTLISDLLAAWARPDVEMAQPGAGSNIAEALNAFAATCEMFDAQTLWARKAIHARRLWVKQTAADVRHFGIPLPAIENLRREVRVLSKSALKATKSKRIAPGCPICAAPMVRRWANGAAGKAARVYGCSRYPACAGPPRSGQIRRP